MNYFQMNVLNPEKGTYQKARLNFEQVVIYTQTPAEGEMRTQISFTDGSYCFVKETPEMIDAVVNGMAAFAGKKLGENATKPELDLRARLLINALWTLDAIAPNQCENLISAIRKEVGESAIEQYRRHLNPEKK